MCIHKTTAEGQAVNHQEKIDLLARYLRFLVEEQKLDVIIFDSAGFLGAHEALSQILQPYMNHMNDYCMYVKSNQSLWARCIVLKERLLRRCGRDDNLFFGTCHCGVGEFILPLRTRFGLSGYISASSYRGTDTSPGRRLAATSRRYLLDEKVLRQRFDDALKQPPEDSRSLALHLSVVALLLNQAIDAVWHIATAANRIYSIFFKLIAASLSGAPCRPSAWKKHAGCCWKPIIRSICWRPLRDTGTRITSLWFSTGSMVFHLAVSVR
jgi:hypothetical protein